MGKKNTHGGRREGSGRGSFFRGKSKHPNTKDPLYEGVPYATSVLLTPTGREALDDVVENLTWDYQKKTENPKARVSRNVVIEGLIRVYGNKLTLAQIERAAAQK
jgi:hypothetical protein